MSLGKIRIGIVAGPLPAAAVELKTLLVAACGESGRALEVFLDWEPAPKDADKETAARDAKMAALDACFRLEDAGADVIMIPSVGLQRALPELQAEVRTPIADWVKAVREETARRGAAKVGVLRGGCWKNGEAFIPEGAEVVTLGEEDAEAVAAAVAEAQAKGLSDEHRAVMKKAAEALKGADVIVPACAVVALAARDLAAAGLPVVDALGAYARSVALNPAPVPVKPFKLGMIGGLGPAATVDLFDKIVKATPAKTDQEHFKIAIEENPQTPDRTACLLEGGADPTLSLYHAAKILEKDGCDAIIIPCNTAHAFLPFLKRRITVPFVDMQQTALEDIAARCRDPRIGLLATSGTIRTGIYAKKAEAMGLPLFTPDEEHQKLVMSAIYGPKGAKAGYTDGVCREELLKAAEYLVREYSCNVLILGCTELPLILEEADEFPLAGTRVAITDPTAVLARKVAKMATEEYAKRGIR